MSTPTITIDEAATQLGVPREDILNAAAQGVLGKVENETLDGDRFTNENWTPDTLARRTAKARREYRAVVTGVGIFVMLSGMLASHFVIQALNISG